MFSRLTSITQQQRHLNLLRGWQQYTFAASLEDMSCDDSPKTLLDKIDHLVFKYMNRHRLKRHQLGEEDLKSIIRWAVREYGKRKTPTSGRSYAEQKTDKDLKRATKHAIQNNSQRLSELHDPFSPLANPDKRLQTHLENPRTKLIWENENCMVIADLDSIAQRLLVVPKDPMSYLTDANTDLQADIEQVSQAVADAYVDTYKCETPDVWVNPPQLLTVSQLHVHIMPDLPPMDAARQISNDSYAARAAVYSAIVPALNQRMNTAGAVQGATQSGYTGFSG